LIQLLQQFSQQPINQMQLFNSNAQQKYVPPPARQNLASNPSQFQQFRLQNFAPQQRVKQETSLEATIQDLKTQIGQLATTVNELVEQKSGSIPAQPVINPKI